MLRSECWPLNHWSPLIGVWGTGIGITCRADACFAAAISSEFRLDVALVLILVTALLLTAVDAFSRRLHRRLRIDTMPTRLSEAPGEARLGRLVAEERLACKA